MHTTPAPSKGPTILDPGDVATRLGLSRVQAWRLMANGDIPGVFDVADGTKSKAYLRVSEADVDQFIDSRKVAPR